MGKNVVLDSNGIMHLENVYVSTVTCEIMSLLFVYSTLI